MAQPADMSAAYFGSTEYAHQIFLNSARNAMSISKVAGLWFSWLFRMYFTIPHFEFQPLRERVSDQLGMGFHVVRRIYENRDDNPAIVFRAQSASWDDTPHNWQLISKELYDCCRLNKCDAVYAPGAIGHLCKIWHYDPAAFELEEVILPQEENQRPGAESGMRMDLLTDGLWIEQKLLMIRQWAMTHYTDTT